MRILPTVLLLCAVWTLKAQFFLNGDAVQLNDSCYQLTLEQNWSVGSIWNPDKISLNESFEVIVQLNFGRKDVQGADGIVFGFQPVSTSIGSGGGGIGFQNVAPSLGIEMDTYQNLNLSDPAYDHLAIIRNGDLNHSTAGTLAGPVQASPSQQNVEDNEFHELRVSWDADALQLRVFFDCALQLIYIGDIVNSIFGGDPEVFWGFTSATGGLNNLHQVCFSYTTFLDELEDVVMCPGGQVPLEARGGASYRWTPATGLSNPNIRNPIASPAQTTTYLVEITDVCGNPFFNELTVEVAGDSVFFDLGPDTVLCRDEVLLLDVSTPTAIYEWSTGAGSPTLAVDRAGAYGVTVTRTDTFCIATDWVSVGFLELPFAELGDDISLCDGQDTLLRVTNNNQVSYLWQDGSSADTFLVSRPGNYSVAVSNICGTARDAVDIFFEDCTQLYIPNAFSPNGDGINDLFFPLDGGDVANISVFRIFNRWGGLLFEATDFLPNDTNNAWNGKFRGEPMNPGAYTWFLQVRYRDGTSETRSGEVILIK